MPHNAPAKTTPRAAIATACAVGILMLMQLDPIAQIAAAKWQADHPENFTYSIIGRT